MRKSLIEFVRVEMPDWAEAPVWHAAHCSLPGHGAVLLKNYLKKKKKQQKKNPSGSSARKIVLHFNSMYTRNERGREREG